MLDRVFDDRLENHLGDIGAECLLVDGQANVEAIGEARLLDRGIVTEQLHLSLERHFTGWLEIERSAQQVAEVLDHLPRGRRVLAGK